VTQQTFTPPDPALAPAFIELAASWPLADADFQILAHLVGLFPQVNDKSQIEIDAPALSKALGIAPRTVVSHLKRLQASGYLDWWHDQDRKSHIGLAPLYRQIGVHYRLLAKSDNRAWLTFRKFPDEPVVILQIEHDLPDNAAIATFTINAWDRLAEILTGREWTLSDFRLQLTSSQHRRPLTAPEAAA